MEGGISGGGPPLLPIRSDDVHHVVRGVEQPASGQAPERPHQCRGVPAAQTAGAVIRRLALLRSEPNPRERLQVTLVAG